MAVYLIEKKLKEDYSESLPQWVLKGLGLIGSNKYQQAKKKKNFGENGLDLANAKFISAEPPKNGRDPFYKDSNKFPVYLLEFDGQSVVYAPGINDDSEVWYDDRYRKLKTIAKKTLLDHTIDFGYIEYDPERDPRAIRRQRQNARYGVDLDRKKNAQFRQPVYGNKLDDGRTDWHTVTGYKWLTKSGYDKSGYKLDPEKYVRQLNSMGLKTYSQKLRKYYTAIKKTQADLAKAITSADIDNTNYKGASHWGRNNVMSDVNDAAKSLERAIDEYRSIQKQIDHIVNRPELSDERKDQYLRDGWGTSGKQLYDYLKEANTAIQAINANESYED